MFPNAISISKHAAEISTNPANHSVELFYCYFIPNFIIAPTSGKRFATKDSTTHQPLRGRNWMQISERMLRSNERSFSRRASCDSAVGNGITVSEPCFSFCVFS
ncbi:hypothetical protein CEXT_377111 [Caerostris extrusa]|uniref:Uncharacterized protein n=1 Tax=Caerostris extrusa TaxID=172846 RepID=A0AAV4W2V4_CAEEX|nr:hypothetical protein CEXT_377111 [Caerostris extrusa]